jgi:hypothetical protein
MRKYDGKSLWKKYHVLVDNIPLVTFIALNIYCLHDKYFLLCYLLDLLVICLHNNVYFLFEGKNLLPQAESVIYGG